MSHSNTKSAAASTTAGSSADWCTIESDPGVFTELLESLGCPHVELEELWTLDPDDVYQQLTAGRRMDSTSLGASTTSTPTTAATTIYGLVLLFQWEQQGGGVGTLQPAPTTTMTTSGNNSNSNNDNNSSTDDLYFARQVVTNACATQALLSVLFNANADSDSDDSSWLLGPTLSQFKSFTSSFSPALKGEAIGASVELKQAHNQFRRMDTAILYDALDDMYDQDDDDMYAAHRKKEEVFHFVAYIGKHGKVYELDGLQPAPIVVGEYQTMDNNAAAAADATTTTTNATTEPTSATNTCDWWRVALSVIQQRVAANPNIIKFNLMAVLHDKRVALQQELLSLQQQQEQQQPPQSSMSNDATSIENDQLQQQQQALLLEALAMEQAKRDRWKLENQRRRHNYLPLVIAVLQELAKDQTKFKTLIQQAQEKRKRNTTSNNSNNKTNGN